MSLFFTVRFCYTYIRKYDNMIFVQYSSHPMNNLLYAVFLYVLLYCNHLSIREWKRLPLCLHFMTSFLLLGCCYWHQKDYTVMAAIVIFLCWLSNCLKGYNHHFIFWKLNNYYFLQISLNQLAGYKVTDEVFFSKQGRIVRGTACRNSQGQLCDLWSFHVLATTATGSKKNLLLSNWQTSLSLLKEVLRLISVSHCYWAIMVQ